MLSMLRISQLSTNRCLEIHIMLDVPGNILIATQ